MSITREELIVGNEYINSTYVNTVLFIGDEHVFFRDDSGSEYIYTLSGALHNWSLPEKEKETVMMYEFYNIITRTVSEFTIEENEGNDYWKRTDTPPREVTYIK